MGPSADAVGARSAAVRAYATLGLLTAVNLLNYADRYVLAGVLPLVGREFGSTDAQLGVLSSSFLLVYALASPFTGLLGDRFPRRWFVGGGAVLWSLATIWSGSAASYGELLLARSLVGIGEAGYAAIAPGLIADLFDVRRRGRILAGFYAALPVGIALGYAVGGAAGAAWGWRAAFWFAGAPGLVLGIAAFWMHEPARGARDAGGAGPDRPSPRAIARTLLRTRSYVVNAVGTAAMTFAMGGLAAWMPTFLYRVRGVPLDRAGVLFGAALIVAGLGGTVAGGWLGDRLAASHGGGYFLASGGGLLLGAPVAVLAAAAPSPAVYWPAIVVALFLLFFNTGPLNAALVNVVPATMRASAVAANVLFIHVCGDALSPAVIGRISDVASLGTAVIANAGVIGLSGAILLAGAGALKHDMALVAAGRSPARRE